MEEQETSVVVPTNTNDAEPPKSEEPSTVEGEEPKMSKNRKKKLAKQEAMKASKKEWREKEKLKKKEKKRLRKEQGLPNKKKKKRVVADDEYAGTVVIDMAFTDLMTDKEVLSLSRQLLHTYAANNRAEKPLRLKLTGCSDKLLATLRGHNDGFDHWQLTVDQRSYMEIYPPSDLVYLTSDTDNVMHNVESSKVYIIGGIVDHNRLKNITVNRANEQGIATAQLPIGDYIEMKSRKVLAVNHVFEILVNVVNNGGDWAAALETTLPSRKEFKVKQKDGGENKDKEDEEKEKGKDEEEEKKEINDISNSTTITQDNNVNTSSGE